MTHARVKLERNNDAERKWWAAIHFCPHPVAGLGLGDDVDEALANARAGLANALSSDAGGDS